MKTKMTDVTQQEYEAFLKESQYDKFENGRHYKNGEMIAFWRHGFFRNKFMIRIEISDEQFYIEEKERLEKQKIDNLRLALSETGTNYTDKQLSDFYKMGYERGKYIAKLFDEMYQAKNN